MSRTPAGRRRLETKAPAGYDLPTRLPRLASAQLAHWLMIATVVAGGIGTALSATSVIATGAPEWVARPGAALLLVVLSAGLTHRGGGHLRIWTVAAALLAVLALVTERNLLLAAASATTAILAAVLAVVITRPAERWWEALRELAISLVVAASGTAAVAAWNAPVNFQRFNLVVIAAALALAIMFVWNLGAGLHGLGKQNLALIAGIAAALVVFLAYSSFVRTHGSEVIVENFTAAVIWMRETFGGIPRPVEVLIGFPALVVGVSVRARRREGWWVLVFAVLGTAVLTTSLVDPNAYPSYIALSTIYSVVLGAIVGLVIRPYFGPSHSRRAARAIYDEIREEPRRIAPLK